MYPLITRDPVTGGELVVTRLMSPQSGIVIEGTFTLGWIGKLTPEQLEFVGVLLRHRGNVQRAAAELGIAYNTARNRLEEIASALGGPPRAGAPAGLPHRAAGDPQPSGRRRDRLRGGDAPAGLLPGGI